MNPELILSKYPILENISLDSPDPKSYLIYGKIQSGKTANLLAFSHFSNIIGIPTILILPNLYSGYLQIRNRISEYNDEMRKLSVIKNIIFSPLSYLYIGDRKNSNFDEKVILSLSSTPSTLISIGNEKQLSYLLDYITLTKAKFNLIVDEGDTAYKSQKTKFRSYYDRLVELSNIVLSISGTTFKAWFLDENLYTSKILILSPPPFYRGIESLNFSIIPEDVKTPKRSESVFASDPYLLTFLLDKSKQSPFRYINKQTSLPSIHPIIVLIRSSEILNDHHFQIQERISTSPRFNKLWINIVYNGQGIKLYVPERFNIKKIKIGNEVALRSGRYFSFKITPLPDVLEYLREKNEEGSSKSSKEISHNASSGFPREITHIAIISGKLCNRMFSFVSRSYYWHLTSLYLNVPKITDCTNLLQMCRICGIYPYDNLPLELAAKSLTISDLQKAYRLQEDIIRKANNVHELMKEFVSSLSLDESKIPKRKLVSGVKYQLNKTSSSSGIPTRKITSGQMVIIDESRLNTTEKWMIEIIKREIRIGVLTPRPELVEIIQLETGKSQSCVNGTLTLLCQKSEIIERERKGLIFKKIKSSGADLWMVVYQA